MRLHHFYLRRQLSRPDGRLELIDLGCVPVVRVTAYGEDGQSGRVVVDAGFEWKVAYVRLRRFEKDLERFHKRL